jgi:hypothetical protein
MERGVGIEKKLFSWGFVLNLDSILEKLDLLLVFPIGGIE